MNSKNPRIDTFIDETKKWKEEFTRLRSILLESALTEDFKWKNPCYTFEGRNIVIMHGFKEYCALLFIKGALLKDPGNILIQQSDNVQAGRQIRFTGTEQIIDMEPVIRRYIEEAIEIEKAGLKVELKQTREYPVPDELQDFFNKDSALKEAFEALTPGRQRGYLLHFAQPKQSKTRISRIEKCIPKIFDGIGLND